MNNLQIQLLLTGIVVTVAFITKDTTCCMLAGGAMLFDILIVARRYNE